MFTYRAPVSILFPVESDLSRLQSIAREQIFCSAFALFSSEIASASML